MEAIVSPSSSEPELTALRWCAELTPLGIGFMGPSLKRGVRFPEYDKLVARGYLKLVWPDGRARPTRDCGYFITPSGQVARREALTGPDRP